MQQEKEQKKEIELAYFDKVDLMFQTYKKSLLDNICLVSESIKLASSMESHFQSHIGLLNMLNTQLNAVTNFLNTYSRLDETV